jgi:hypothetical protein
VGLKAKKKSTHHTPKTRNLKTVTQLLLLLLLLLLLDV